MKQNSEAAAARASMRRVEEGQAALRKLLEGAKLAQLTKRPPSGAWSPMENVRHLLFAEQYHFGPHLPKGFKWASAGVPPPNKTGERRLSPVGSQPDATVDEVFAAWAKINGVVRGLCSDPNPALVFTLEANLLHLRQHTKEIERVLRR